MTKNIPTAFDIIKDVEERIKLLGKLLDLDQTLSEDEWKKLIYYKQYHSAQKEEFIEALNLLRKGETDLSFMDKLSPHARWLSAVYTGQELTSKWCYGGSRFHKKLMNLLGDGSPPKLIIRHVRDLKDEINKLQIRFSQVNPKVIENIAVDESFERIGRVLS